MSELASSELIAFNDLANEAARDLGEAIMQFAEDPARGLTGLPPGSIFIATVVGATTGALKVLFAASQAGMVVDRQVSFETLLRQMADVWGQIDDQPAAGSLVQ